MVVHEATVNGATLIFQAIFGRDCR
jgi:hypothetical protein